MPLFRLLMLVLAPLAPPALAQDSAIATGDGTHAAQSGTDAAIATRIRGLLPWLGGASHGPVRDRLEAAGADQAVFAAWDDVVVQEIRPEEDDEE